MEFINLKYALILMNRQIYSTEPIRFNFSVSSKIIICFFEYLTPLGVRFVFSRIHQSGIIILLFHSESILDELC